MATKLKNFPYSPFVKVVSVFFLLLAAAVLTVAMAIVYTGGDLEVESYYGTSEFYYDYGRIAHNAIEKYLLIESEEEIIKAGYEASVEDTLIQRIRLINKNLNMASGFIFVLENMDTGALITNIAEKDPVEHIKSRKSCEIYEENTIYLPEASRLSETNYSDYNAFSNEILDVLQQVKTSDGTSWRYYTALMDGIPKDDGFFYENYKDFNYMDGYQDLLRSAIGIACLMALVVLVYYWFVAGKSCADMTTKLSKYDEIPHEFQLIITGIFMIPIVMYFNVYNGFDWELGDPYSGLISIVTFVEILTIALLIQYLSMIRLIKTRQFFKKLGLVRIAVFLLGLIKLPRIDQGYRLKVLIWVAGWLILNAIACFLVIELPPIGLIMIVFINVFVFRRLFRVIDGLKELMSIIHNRRLGKSSKPIEVDKLPLSLMNFAEDLEALQDGLDVALEEMIRGEKLKTELITNVTHDLKNPLTSIISYVELLKGKEAYDEETRKYIDVLAEKANRLKALIEQLVDASKASSGNVEICLQSVDMVQLSRQLCGEFSDSLEASLLECLVSQMDQPHYVLADPMVLYRILENLMSNVCKYSMGGTRVYVDIKEEGEEVIYSIKNISSEPLNIEVEDLSRRFVRGDSSRNTEGSGLGLSIALSLAKLIGAKLSFEIDGDLFKAILVMKTKNLPAIE